MLCVLIRSGAQAGVAIARWGIRKLRHCIVVPVLLSTGDYGLLLGPLFGSELQNAYRYADLRIFAETG